MVLKLDYHLDATSKLLPSAILYKQNLELTIVEILHLGVLLEKLNWYQMPPKGDLMLLFGAAALSSKVVTPVQF